MRAESIGREALCRTARLYLLLCGERLRLLTDEQVAERRRRYPG